MRKVAIFEKAKTPYRPPLFEYIGKNVDLTVFYVGTPAKHRQWSVDHVPEHYSERTLSNHSFGPLSLSPELRNTLGKNEYDEIVIGPELDMLCNSFLAVLEVGSTSTDVTIWTENVTTPWIRGKGRPAHMRIAKKISRGVVTRVQKQLYQRADSVIAYSNLAAEAAKDIGASENKITTAPQWYPPDILSYPESEPYIFQSKTYRVLFVGQLSERKGVDTLIKTAKKYDSEENIEFIFAGDGPLYNLVSTANKNCSHITQLGYVSEEEKVSQYIAADLFVLPSRHDPWGLVVNEAYITDTPVVTTTTTGAEMIVPDELTTVPESPSMLFSVIERARTSSVDAPNQPSIQKMAEPIIEPPRERNQC